MKGTTNPAAATLTASKLIFRPLSLAIGAAATIYLPFVLADAMDTYEPVP